jgi:hypothetical protein
MTTRDLNPGTRFKQDLETATNLKQILFNQRKLIAKSNEKYVDTKNFFGQILASRVYTKDQAISATSDSFIKTLAPASSKFIGYKVYIPELNGIYPHFDVADLQMYLGLFKQVDPVSGKNQDIKTHLESQRKQDVEKIYSVARRINRYTSFFCAGDNQEPAAYPQYCEVEIIDVAKPLHYGTFKRVIGDDLTRADYEPKETDYNE